VSTFGGILKTLGFRVALSTPDEEQSTSGEQSFTLRSPGVDCEALEHTTKFVRSVVEALYDFSSEKMEIILSLESSSFSLFFLRVLAWPLEDRIKNAKFFCSYPMARFLRNDLPKAPPKSYGYTGSVGSALLFEGPVRRFLKNRILSGSRKNVELMNTLLLGVKRACARAPECFIEQSLEAHRAAMTRVPEVDEVHLSQASSYLTRLWAGVKIVHSELCDPTTSACFGSTAAAGGAYEYLREKEASGHLERVTRPNIPVSYLSGMYETGPGRVQEYRTGSELRTTVDLTARIERSGVPELSSVQVQTILEPLKVRLITKGWAEGMWLGRIGQRAMHSYLKKMPMFSLIGHPLEIDDLRDLRRRTLLQPETRGFRLWVSGDYSAATDNLKLPYTKASFETVLRNSSLTEVAKDTLRRILYEQYVVYPPRGPPEDRTEEVWVKQTNGQLMGSILSFPNLCAINLVTYCMALEEYTGRRWSLLSLPLLVNGDDILFMANAAFYAIWKRHIAEVGFELSQGKNYVHEHFVMVNSEPYWFTEEAGFEHLRYLNIGLLTGESKLTARPSQRTAPVWDFYNRTIAGAHNRARAHYRFLQLNREALASFTEQGLYNLFVDPHLGGLGFTLYEEVRPYVKFTTFQKQFGHYLLRQMTSMEADTLPSAFIGIVREEKERQAPLMYRHHGTYTLRSYRNEGSVDQPVWKMLLDQERERLPIDRSIRRPLFSGIHGTGEVPMKIVHPKRSVLRSFRQSKPKKLTTGALLTCPREWIELCPKDSHSLLLEHQFVGL